MFYTAVITIHVPSVSKLLGMGGLSLLAESAGGFQRHAAHF
jgi:hypothetical protein